jgi:hypothetical protein
MLRFLGGAAAALAIACVTVMLLPLDDSGVHGPALSEVPDAISSEVERSRKLDEALAVGYRLREERIRIVSELDAGTIKLDEAIEQILELRHEDTVTWDFLSRYHHDHTAEEIAGYQMIVAAFSRPDPNQEANRALMKRVHAKLKERFGSRVLVPPHLADRLAEPAANP